MAEAVNQDQQGVRVGLHNGYATVFHNGSQRMGLTTTPGFGPNYITVMTMLEGEDGPKVQILGIEDFLHVVHHAADILGEIEDEENDFE